VRDPRDVISSFKHQRWTPNTTEACLSFYKAIISQWFKIKKQIPQESLMEIKLEDLVVNTESTLRRITDKFSFKYNTKMLRIDLSKSHSGRWKAEFNNQEKIFLKKELKSIMGELEYDN
jgi:endonuclease III-like uncharacterized protein